MTALRCAIAVLAMLWSSLAMAADTTPPFIIAVTPANGATIAGSAVTFTFTAADDVAVLGVTYVVDGVSAGEDVNAPYTAKWNTLSSPNGPHVFQGRARDAAGNLATATINVTIANPIPPVASVAPGTYAVPQNVALSAVASTSIRYTLDNTTPSCTVGTVYTNPIAIGTGNSTIKAIACFAAGPSTVATFLYTISPPPVGVTLGAEVAVGATLGGNQYQQDLRINPLNPNQITITAKTGTAETTTAILNTQNGAAWTSTAITSSGDPDVMYDLLGNAHMSFIDKAAGSQIGYRKSTTGGATWNAKITIPMAVDHPHIYVDRIATSPFRGSIYIAGRGYNGKTSIARSRDAGATWQVTSLTLDSNLALGFVWGMTTLADGTLLIPMTNGQTIITTPQGTYGGTSKSYFVLRSTDGGITFTKVLIGLNSTPVTTFMGGFFGLGNLVSGPNGTGERVYLTYTQVLATGPAQLMLRTSDDKGLTWSAPRAIVTASSNGGGVGSMSPMLTTSGILGIQYYSKTATKFDIYFTYSTDKGATFSAPIKLSTATSSQLNPQPRVPGQDQVYADVGPDGKFYAVWQDSRGTASVYTTYMRTITVPTGAPLAPLAPSPIALGVTFAKAGAGDPLPTIEFTDDAHPAGMQLAFHDGFDGASLNRSTWVNTYNWGGRVLLGNGEKECYLEKNVEVSNGVLTLHALKENVMCPGDRVLQAYTSGMINSSQSYVQKYGYFVMRAKLPAGQGYWPAFWLLPANGSWPPEIDIFEVLGHQPTRVFNAYHYLEAGMHKTFGTNTYGADTSTDYHLFAVDWQPGSIGWYVDGAEVYRLTDASVYAGPMYILANLGIGGYWPGYPNASTLFPNSMSVDYIRTYQ